MYHKLNIRIITQTPRREMTSTYQLITFPQQLASSKVDYPRRQHALLENPASMDQRLKVNTIPPEIALNKIVELRLRGRAGPGRPSMRSLHVRARAELCARKHPVRPSRAAVAAILQREFRYTFAMLLDSLAQSSAESWMMQRESIQRNGTPSLRAMTIASRKVLGSSAASMPLVNFEMLASRSVLIGIWP
jgi:hypothetical protein